jgi:elongation factor 1-gamma
VNHKDKRGAGFDHFLEKVDRKGYSVWHIHYDKYPGEGEVHYMFANSFNGFLQRCDHFRKHVFANHLMLGEEPKLEIKGVWMFRGPIIPQEMIDNPQMEYFFKRQLDLDNKEDQDLIRDYWCAKVDDKVGGEVVVEQKMHK